MSIRRIVKRTFIKLIAAGVLFLALQPAWGQKCTAVFAVPRDTTVGEGAILVLVAKVECASSYAWSAESGLAPRVVDPRSKRLSVCAPRTRGDTLMAYRFAAGFPTGPRSAVVRIKVREAIPDPDFSLPDSLTWDGIQAKTLRPSIPALAAIRKTRDSVIRYTWSITPAGFPVDTVWQAGALLLRSSSAKGPFTVGLCLDNGWTPICRTMAVRITLPVPVSLSLRARVTQGMGTFHAGLDAMGRRQTALRPGRRVYAPMFTIP